MEFKVEKKDAFTVYGAKKVVPYEDAQSLISQFWVDYFKDNPETELCGQFGISIEDEVVAGAFSYLIADPVAGAGSESGADAVLEGMTVLEIPAFTWLVFPTRGPMPESIQETCNQIYSAWLPMHSEYQIAADYLVESYSSPDKYADGTLDEEYYSEVWIPVEVK